MYNKIFTKILDSSIWLEPDATRIVWITMIAAMDEHGFCQFASVRNLAQRAVVSVEHAEEAVVILESPDRDSSDPENDGRRIERVPGGWMVLNAEKYRSIVTRAVGQEKTRLRVAKFRAKKAGNADVTTTNDVVTPSEALAVSETTATATKPVTVTAFEVAQGVMHEAPVSGGRDFLPALEIICRGEMVAGRDPSEVRDAMVAGWRDFVKERDKLTIQWGAEKFFGEGHWKGRGTWKYRKESVPEPDKPKPVVESVVDRVRRQEAEDLKR